MLVWVLIVCCWGGLLLLILHDTTKEDSKASAISAASLSVVSVASKVLKNFFNWTRSWTKKIALAPRKIVAVGRSAGKYPITIPAGSLANPAQNGQPITIEWRPVTARKHKWFSKDRRASITPAELELTIAEAVRKTAPGCEDFIGVIVYYRAPKINLDPNWAVRGVKFGKADRKMVDEVLNSVVEQLQQEFRLIDP
jgi:hypothetical protein